MKSELWHRGVLAAELVLVCALVSACGGAFQTAGNIAQGRQALFRGDYQTALANFQSAEQTDPNYIFGTEMREGVLSYLGRAQYLTGQLPQARQTLQRALALHRSDNLARLYLGLTLARLDDRKNGLQDIERGLRGITHLLNYIINAFSYGFGQYWDPNHDIRKAVASTLAMVAQGNFSWESLISSSEKIAMNMEQEPDRARQQEEQQMEMQMDRGP